MDSTGSATIINGDVLRPDWSVGVGQTLVSQCPVASVFGHGGVSRFDDGLTVRWSKCAAAVTLGPRMTARVTDCEGKPIRSCMALFHVGLVLRAAGQYAFLQCFDSVGWIPVDNRKGIRPVKIRL